METARASIRPAEDLSRLDRMRSLRWWKRVCWAEGVMVIDVCVVGDG